MRKIFVFLFITIFLVNLSFSQDFTVKKESIYTPEQTVEKLELMLEGAGFKVFTVINHKKAAENVGMRLPFSSVIVFGKPLVGTKFIQENPLAALELPLKILVFREKGKTYVAYKSPFYIERTYHLERFHRVFKKLNKKLESITDKLSN